MNHKRQWKHRSPGKEAQLGWNVVPQRRATWGLCDCSEIRSLRCRDGSWLEIILDLHWALNPIWDKETRRGRPRREEERQEPGSQKPKRRGLLARTAGRESVSSRLSLRLHTRNPPCWHRDLRALAPKLAEHTSLLLNHLVCRTVSRQSRGLTQRLKPAGALWPHGTPIFLLQFAKVKDAPPTKPLSTHSVGLLVFFYKAKK